MLDTKETYSCHLLSEIRHPRLDIRHLTSENWCPTADIRDSKSDIQHLTSDIRNPKSEIRNPTSDIQHPRLDILFLSAFNILAARAGDLLPLELSAPFSQDPPLKLQKRSILHTAKVDTHATMSSLESSFRMLLPRVQSLGAYGTCVTYAGNSEREREDLPYFPPLKAALTDIRLSGSYCACVG